MKSYPVLAGLGALVLITLGAGLAQAIVGLHPNMARDVIYVQVRTF